MNAVIIVTSPILLILAAAAGGELCQLLGATTGECAALLAVPLFGFIMLVGPYLTTRM